MGARWNMHTPKASIQGTSAPPTDQTTGEGPRWEIMQQQGKWISLGHSISQWIESQWQNGEDKCDYLVGVGVGHTRFRVYFRDMCHQDLSTKEVTSIRRNPEPPARPLEDAKAITQWRIHHAADVDPENREEICAICLDPLFPTDESEVREVVQLSKCGCHYFHSVCISQCLEKTSWSAACSLRCPVCNQIYGIRTGIMPHGTMHTQLEDESLPGFDSCNVIRITYRFPSGIQGPGHATPGQEYAGTTRVCYLPHNERGLRVLEKLKIAFERGLTFTIGTSVTTGRANCVVWNGIHHKTNIHGGPSRFGYPDETYLNRVTNELAQMGIHDGDLPLSASPEKTNDNRPRVSESSSPADAARSVIDLESSSSGFPEIPRSTGSAGY